MKLQGEGRKSSSRSSRVYTVHEHRTGVTNVSPAINRISLSYFLFLFAFWSRDFPLEANPLSPETAIRVSSAVRMTPAPPPLSFSLHSTVKFGHSTLVLFAIPPRLISDKRRKSTTPSIDFSPLFSSLFFSFFFFFFYNSICTAQSRSSKLFRN